MDNSTIATQCCIAGGGPAGMMLGYLLARAGVHVVVLEKHADFFRDFRGDTVHPSTLELMFELGLMDKFLKLPHQEVETLSAQIGAEHVEMVDFRHLPTHCKFVALMPQWDFLNFLAGQGKRYKTFDLRMQAEARDLIEENGRIVGLIADTPDGALTIRADLTVGCDGRHSTVREKAGLKSDDYGAPMDVLWFRVSHKGGDKADTFGHIEAGRLMVMFDRGDYWQCAYVIPKGGIERVKSEGLEAFHARVVEMSPFLSDRIGELKSWDDHQAAQRHGRSAAKMVAARPHLHRRCGACDVADRRRGDQHGGAGRGRRRQPARRPAARRQGDGRGSSGHRGATHAPVKFTQWMQLTIQRRVVNPVLQTHERPKAPAFFKLFGVFPILRSIPARLVGIGIRPEHVQTPEGGPN